MEDAGGHLAGRPTQTRRRQHLVWNRWAGAVYLKTAGAGHRLTANDPAIFENVLGPEHPRSAATLNNLACLLRDQGELAGARPLFNRALTACEKALGPEHPYTNRVRSNLAALRLAAGCTDRSTCARRESS